MKAVVIYRSKTGYVKKYAEWIAKRLQADIYEESKVTIDKVMNYDTVIYGGGLYAGGINGVKFITRNLEKLSGKKLVVFASGATPPRESDIIVVRDKNFTQEQLKHIKFYYLRGGFDYSRLKPVDKLLMNFLKMTLKRKKEPTADDRGMLEAYNKPIDFTREKNIDELVKYVMPDNK